VKLRLRGRGSGFKEGPNNQESDEPLHLCISSKYLDKYKNACTLVQELVSSVYDDYKKFCDKNHRNYPNFQIKKVEGTFSRKDADGHVCSYD